jgi:hypothetical protein
VTIFFYSWIVVFLHLQDDETHSSEQSLCLHPHMVAGEPVPFQVHPLVGLL